MRFFFSLVTMIFFVTTVFADVRLVNKSDVILQQLPNTQVKLTDNNVPVGSPKRKLTPPPSLAQKAKPSPNSNPVKKKGKKSKPPKKAKKPHKHKRTKKRKSH